MKKNISLVILVFLALTEIASGQSVFKAIRLSNSLHDLWEKGNIDKAVKNSLDLYSIDKDMFAELAFTEPTDANMVSLKALYDNSGKEESFDQYWRNFIHNKGRPMPSVSIPFDSEVLDFAKTSGSWTYVYVWGTWCGPCVQDLPNLQAFYQKNLEAADEKLKIYTLSFGSRNLQGFMKKKGYDFPVSEITHDMTEVLGIQGYPTKMLISPEGNYVIIPFGFDWQSYLRNYVLL